MQFANSAKIFASQKYFFENKSDCVDDFADSIGRMSGLTEANAIARDALIAAAREAEGAAEREAECKHISDTASKTFDVQRDARFHLAQCTAREAEDLWQARWVFGRNA